MNSNLQGPLWAGLGVLAFAGFVRDVIGYFSNSGLLPGENPVLAYGFTILLLVGAVSCFISAISAFKHKG